MKYFAIFLMLIPSLSFAFKIPVESFDQSKLQSLLSKIPSALVKSETMAGFLRKTYLFPKSKNAPIKIECQADYFSASSVPSYKSCGVTVERADQVGDEYSITISDVQDVSQLRSAISYGEDTKKIYSTERIYGQASDGKYRDLFRYSFVCESQSCNLTFVKKESL
jgi:hypothetical protein